MTWADAVEPVVAGLAAVLGVYATQEVAALLRARGLWPERWNKSRTFLLPRTSAEPDAE